ncbi:MAG: acetylxylan esterase, partial [Lentisphaeria bacterium]|nr:acetylxylan esterase [Lentisphaeria bacterium]
DARITGTVQRDGYRIEKVIYFSRPGFPVTGNMYIPDNLTGPAPSVLFVCGHSFNGKASDAYQRAMQSFALQGYVVLGIEPFGQGERLQYGKDSSIVVCTEHNVVNRRLLPLDDSTGTWRIWDAIRGVDYMLTRKEVDPAKIAVNGNSGGGTMTSLIFAVEDRVSMACPNCYITTWLRNVENELPVDAEQIPPANAVNGGEMADLLIAAAPRPVLIQGQKNDFFDLRGTREAYLEVKKVYDLLGYGDRVEFFYGPEGHGYSWHLRENCYRFFNKHMGLPGFADGKEPAAVAEIPEEELYCTPEGSVLTYPGNKTIHEFIAEKTDAVRKEREALSADELREKIAALLGIKNGLPLPPYYRQLRPACLGEKKDRIYSRFLMETEENMRVPMFLFDGKKGYYHLPDDLGDVVLYVPHQDTKNEIEAMELAQGEKIFGVDYRGVGEVCPDGCDQYNRDFFAAYLYDYHYASLSLLLGESYLGGRVWDVLNAVALLKQHGARKITLRCSGIGRVVALLAAFIGKVDYAPDKALESCSSACIDKLGPLPQSMGCKGFLKLTDFDELAKLV